MNNFFAIKKPETVDCAVMQYHWGRSQLIVRLKRQNSPEVQFIRFGGVEYVSAPIHWTGAEFTLQPASECLVLLQQVGRAGLFVTEEQLQERGISLYTVNLPESQVKIVARIANKYSA